MNTLKDIRDQMVKIVGRPEMLGFVNARLVLRTGITLNDPNQKVTADELSRVVSVLKDMGYAVEAKEGRS